MHLQSTAQMRHGPLYTVMDEITQYRRRRRVALSIKSTSASSAAAADALSLAYVVIND